jgi:hypothetical protein
MAGLAAFVTVTVRDTLFDLGRSGRKNINSDRTFHFNNPVAVRTKRDALADFGQHCLG